MSTKNILDRVLSDYAFFTGVNPVLPQVRSLGRGNLVVLVGDNATGKSIFRRVWCMVCKDMGIENIPLSMEGRQSQYMGAMVYGDENSRSTGENSAHTVLIGIKTCRSRTQPHQIFWDEPDIGLSDDWAAGMGQEIRAFAEDLPTHTKAVVVVTHRRALLRELLPANPHYVAMGAGAPPTLEEWINRPITPRPLEELGEISHRTFRAIQKILDKKREKRAT
jgi:hypothetical protein